MNKDAMGDEMPAYGVIPWADLVRAVGEAIGSAFSVDTSYYVGHQMCGINMNSLNRIVSKFVAQACIAESEKPIDMILHYPACLEQHVDAATETWPNEPHRSHLCQHCGFIWRPCDHATNGVAEIKTRGKDDMVMLDGPLEVLRRVRMQHDLNNPPKLDWDGEPR